MLEARGEALRVLDVDRTFEKWLAGMQTGEALAVTEAGGLDGHGQSVAALLLPLVVVEAGIGAGAGTIPDPRAVTLRVSFAQELAAL